MVLNRISNVEFYKVKGSILLYCLFISLIISLSPFKILSYCIPLFLLGFILLKLFSKTFYRKLFISILVCVGIILFYYSKSKFLNHDFSLPSAYLSLITYGSIIFILIYPKLLTDSDSPQTNKLQKYLYVILLIETVVAIVQLALFIIINATSLDESTGDIIQGTINPFSFISDEVGFNNQVFTINYIFLLIYEIPYLLKTKRKYLIVIGILVILLASVLHVVFSFALALLTSFLLIGIIKFRKQLFRFFLACVFIIGLLFITQPKNFSLIGYYSNSIVSLESPKVIVIANTIAFLPEEYPDALLFGLGPGQYTSRASLISSGRYFGEFENPVKLPFLDASTASKAFNDYIFDIWEVYATNVEIYGNSTMSRPFFSILSLVIEFGLIFFGVILILLFRYIGKIRKRYLEANLEEKKTLAYYHFANMVSVLFIFYLAFFENYLESSASICAGLLLIKYFSNIKSESLKPMEN